MLSRTLARCVALACGILWATGTQACDSDCDCYGGAAYANYGGSAYGYLAPPIYYAPPTYAYYQPVPIPYYAAPAYAPIYVAPVPLGYGSSYPPNYGSPYWRGYAGPAPRANPALAQHNAAVALTRLARPLGAKAFAPQTTRMIDPAPVRLHGKPAIQLQATGAKALGAVFAPTVAPPLAPKVAPKLAAPYAAKTAPYLQGSAPPARTARGMAGSAMQGAPLLFAVAPQPMAAARGSAQNLQRGPSPASRQSTVARVQ